MFSNTATGLSTMFPLSVESQPAYCLGVQPALGCDVLPMPPISGLGTGVTFSQDGVITCPHCKRTLDESSYKCQPESGGCGKLVNQECSDTNCPCKNKSA
ncbi:hypothetical protein PG987_010860 [Apiospora arundinis]